MAPGRSRNGWWIAAVMTLFLAPLGLYMYYGGWVHGDEFSPDDFSRRSFSYNVVPFLNITLRGIEYHDATPVFEQTLYADGFIGKAGANKRWHLIRDNISDQHSSDFDARFLCRYLDLTDDNNESIWISWNNDHPKLATSFWPIIAELARENLYVDISPIMLKAMSLSKESAQQFETWLDHTASAALLALAEDLQQKKAYDRAVEVYTKSIEIQPSRDAWLGRAACYQDLGKIELSKDDLAEAETVHDQ